MRDWCRKYGANENAACVGGPFFCEAVSAHHPVFLSWRLPPSHRSPARDAMHSEKTNTKRPIPVKRELEPSALWRRDIPEELRCRKAVGASKVAGARRVGARSPLSRRSRIAPLNYIFYF